MHDCRLRENNSPIFSGNVTWKWAIKVNQMILPLARLLDNGTIWACKCRSHGSALSRLTGCQHCPVNGPHCVAKHCSVLDYFQCCLLPSCCTQITASPLHLPFHHKPLCHNCTTAGYVTMQTIKNGAIRLVSKH